MNTLQNNTEQMNSGVKEKPQKATLIISCIVSALSGACLMWLLADLVIIPKKVENEVISFQQRMLAYEQEMLSCKQEVKSVEQSLSTCEIQRESLGISIEKCSNYDELFSIGYKPKGFTQEELDAMYTEGHVEGTYDDLKLPDGTLIKDFLEGKAN